MRVFVFVYFVSCLIFGLGWYTCSTAAGPPSALAVSPRHLSACLLAEGDCKHLQCFAWDLSLTARAHFAACPPQPMTESSYPCLLGRMTQSGKFYTTPRSLRQNWIPRTSLVPCWRAHHLLAASPLLDHSPTPCRHCLHCPNTRLTPISCLRDYQRNQTKISTSHSVGTSYVLSSCVRLYFPNCTSGWRRTRENY